MNLHNCRLCKRPKEYSAFYMCNDCLLELEKVRTYIKKHPFATLEEISLATELSKETIGHIISFFPNTQIKQY
ncbi:hypothetical protein [Ornithinibacillus halotolerans]|uniref:Uncharacterized protein n=1 Tax=Ornithinibacillus halotolerans TaxID=1274357 RepID=A0A916RY45_9BACI|nr:hypothetical protein [Ornithinibacillus halotolerans]GGA73042.1 hypothetical protein GCM10008025_15950 [Ornithinibacillus halotolerans]